MKTLYFRGYIIPKKIPGQLLVLLDFLKDLKTIMWHFFFFLSSVEYDNILVSFAPFRKEKKTVSSTSASRTKVVNVLRTRPSCSHTKCLRSVGRCL